MKTGTKLFFIFLLIKSAHALYLAHLLSCQSPRILGKISFGAGDTYSYTGAMENFISEGTYYFNNGRENVYAGRMPHYSIPYFLFRQVAPVSLAHDLNAGFQVIIQCIAMSLLVLLAYRLTQSKLVAIILFLALIAESNWTIFSLHSAPESLSCSFLVFFIFAYSKYLQNKSLTSLLIAGLGLSLLVSMKVYYIIVFVPIGIHFLLENKGSMSERIRPSFIKTLVISIPLFVLICPWAVRNYSIYSRFIPFQINSTAGYNYTDAEFSFRKFVIAWGGDIIFWEKKSAGCYFISHPELPCEFKMPEYAFCDGYGPKEVEEVRRLFISLQKKYSDSLDRVVAEKFDQMTSAYRSAKPFRYYFISRAVLTFTFLFHSGSYYLPVHRTSPCFAFYQMPIKLIQSGLYWLSLVVGLPGILLLSIKMRNSVLIFIPLFLIVLFPIVLGQSEARYFRTVEPILYLGAAYLLANMPGHFSEKIRKFVDARLP